MRKYGLHIRYLILFLVVIFLFGFASYKHDHRKLEEIDVMFENGDNLFISYEMVNKLLIQNLTAVENQSKENINLNVLEQFVQNNDMVENAEIFLELNGDLGVIITQRTPILRVANSSGSYYYDKQGVEMPLSNNYSARIPITSNELNKENCMDIICLANTIESDNFLRQQIIGVNQKENGESIQFELETRLGDHKIEFGEYKNVKEKIKKLKVFYQKTISENTLDAYKTINLKFKNQVVCEKY